MCSDIQSQLHPCITRLGRSPFDFIFQTFQNCGSVENPPRVENVFKQSKAASWCKVQTQPASSSPNPALHGKIVSNILREKKSIWRKVSSFKRILKAPLQTGETFPTGKATCCSSNMPV
jgi:hypothetical protein